MEINFAQQGQNLLALPVLSQRHNRAALSVIDEQAQ
jgi:hypothetical protein